MKRMRPSPVSVLHTEATCCQCGMVKSEWAGNHGRGYEKEGDRYCCDRCANDTGCSCFEMARKAAAATRPIKRSAPKP